MYAYEVNNPIMDINISVY